MYGNSLPYVFMIIFLPFIGVIVPIIGQDWTNRKKESKKFDVRLFSNGG